MVPIWPKTYVILLRVQFRVDIRPKWWSFLAFIQSHPTNWDAQYFSRCLKSLVPFLSWKYLIWTTSCLLRIEFMWYSSLSLIHNGPQLTCQRRIDEERKWLSIWLKRSCVWSFAMLGAQLLLVFLGLHCAYTERGRIWNRQRISFYVLISRPFSISFCLFKWSNDVGTAIGSCKRRKSAICNVFGFSGDFSNIFNICATTLVRFLARIKVDMGRELWWRIWSNLILAKNWRK